MNANAKLPAGNFFPPLMLPQHPGKKTIWSPLPGGAEAFAIAQCASASKQTLAVITPDNDRAAELTAELHSLLSTSADADEADTLEVICFRDRETLPYDVFSPPKELCSERLAALSALGKGKRQLIVLSLNTALHRLPPSDYLHGNSLHLTRGQNGAKAAFEHFVNCGGYQLEQTVTEHGQYAQRGAICDVYPMGSPMPYRIEWLDDQIESIRSFIPETQRGIQRQETLRLLPTREFPLEEQDITRFRNEWNRRFSAHSQNSFAYRDISNGIAFNGSEYYLPLFFDALADIFDYLPPDCPLILSAGLHAKAQILWTEIRARHESRRNDPSLPALPPAELFLSVEEFFSRMGQYPIAEMRADAEGTGALATAAAAPKLTVSRRAKDPLSLLRAWLEKHGGATVICATSPGRQAVLTQLLERNQLRPEQCEDWGGALRKVEPGKLLITTTPLAEGALLGGHDGLCVLTERELFDKPQHIVRRRDESYDDSLAIRNLAELHEGDPVVHRAHGVGRYLGLEMLDETTECLRIQYANGEILTPISSLRQIVRYTGAEDKVTLSHLGSNKWRKQRKRAQEEINDMAAELLELYARRKTRSCSRQAYDQLRYEGFCAECPFELTADQQAACDAMRADITSDKPMDRLICGDVGFGKTEVAMRAAFLAASQNRQIAVLTPTTLLAQQHLESFRERFIKFPELRVEGLSRFSSGLEAKQVIKQAASGKIDILIGTHSLLQERLKLPRLGLIILDEEHRFGVRHKEQLKQLRAEADVLALTATPIPRSLNMAMGGLRALSIIATPPPDRLAIRTFVAEFEHTLVREALSREINRGGQAYYLHNKLATIEETKEDLAELLPEARIGVAHGGIQKRELERVMRDFQQRRFNILLCSVIIESGIDVPNANTIVIERADKLGLAQLHQLRGRVGRADRQAYAYLLTAPRESLKPKALRRLEAIAQASKLGSGFMLAEHDLEIRGAGELLGKKQSGEMHKIGFQLYSEMLAEAVDELRDANKSGANAPPELDIDIDLRIPALIPKDYLPDVNTRLIMYKRIASTRKQEELDELKGEMIDRFGQLPQAVENLFAITVLRIPASRLRACKISADKRGVTLDFLDDTPLQATTMTHLMLNEPARYRLAPGAENTSRLHVRFDEEPATGQARIACLEALLAKLIDSFQDAPNNQATDRAQHASTQSR